MKLRIIFILAILTSVTYSIAQSTYLYKLKSPNQKIAITVASGTQTTWAVTHESTIVLSVSPISMLIKDKGTLGINTKVISAKNTTTKESFATPIYKKDSVNNHYNQLEIKFKGDYALQFRAYDDGVAYRFVTSQKDSITVIDEPTSFIFDKDYKTFAPLSNDFRDGQILQQAFEALYSEVTISKIPKDALAFLPLLVELEGGKKACLLEADLENYPGMFLQQGENHSLKSHYAAYPKKEKNGGFNHLNYMVTERENHLLKTRGSRSFPWRAIVVSTTDKELANNDMVQKLSSPSRVKDLSWIKPGKVAWDWWNDWNISKVDFVAGVNTQTYKYYIDFAAQNKIEYVVLDEGWSNDTNLTQVSDKMNVEELIRYAKEKQVGIILWATWYAIQKDIHGAFDKYSRMGVKGFKIDFIDRDDAKMVSSLYHIADIAAQYKLVLDYHGMYKPSGIQRTYPNILNFEGVKGLEHTKWAPNDDVPRFDVSIPFIRMMAGPLDYTPGAMRNASKSNFRAIFSNPMSQGTRCHQLAMYSIFEAPLQMLADNPSAYYKEQECTDFIAQIPTTFQKTLVLDGKVGEYIIMARKNKDRWYLAAMTNWTAREASIDLSFLGTGEYQITIFKDGLNADKEATDYVKESRIVTSKDPLKIKMASGGGWAAIIQEIKK